MPLEHPSVAHGLELAAALRASEARYRSLFENMLDGFAYCRMLYQGDTPVDFVYLAVNQSFERITGLTEVAGRHVSELIPGIRDTNPELLEVYGRVARSRAPERFQTRVPQLDVVVDVAVYSPEPDHFVAVFQDITARVRAEERVRDSEERFRRLAENAPDIIYRYRLLPDPAFEYVSPAVTAVTGYTPQDHYDDPDLGLKLIHPDDLPLLEPVVRGDHPPGTPLVCRWRRRDGRMIWTEQRIVTVRDAAGRAVAIEAIARDITARKATEEQVLTRTRALEAAAHAVVITDTSGIIEWANPAFTHLTGFSVAEAVGHKTNLLSSGRTTLASYEHMWRTVLAGEVWSSELVNRRKDGSFYHEEMTITPVRAETGVISHFIAIKQDVSARHAAAEALRASEEQFHDLAENITQVFFIVDPDTAQCSYVNRAYEEVWGRSCDLVLATPRAWMTGIHPDDVEVVAREGRRLRGGTAVVRGEFRVVRPDGTVRWVRGHAYPIRDTGGRTRRVVGVVEDVTELHHKDQQLVQAQKLEAVGLLAGGVAHDFNNVLTVVQSYAEMLAADVPATDPRAEDLAQIIAAVKRAQGLTRQLLAFSRQQVLQPVVLDPAAVVAGFEKMLHRLIGEDIELEITLATHGSRIRVDPGQFEQVLLNLAVNARDAMPRGGRLTIATAHIDADADTASLHDLPGAGRYVVVSATDNGTGMTPEIRARIFDPFFTTKEAGLGTGLGLATVYGIVKQSGGSVTVQSEPGVGSVFRIYLPAVADAVSAAPVTAEAPARGGSETVLLAEDDPFLRSAVAEILTRHGYAVLPARNGEEALARAASHGTLIQLLVTDVVMPGMDGAALAASIREHHPHIKVLFTSGYAGDAIVRRGIHRSGLPFLEKPFSIAGLLSKVREVLDLGVAARP